MDLRVVPVENPDGLNLILGQSHFIETVEDLHETLAGASPHLRFGIAFCESSGPRLVRRSRNDQSLVELASRNALTIGAGDGGPKVPGVKSGLRSHSRVLKDRSGPTHGPKEGP